MTVATSPRSLIPVVDLAAAAAGSTTGATRFGYACARAAAWRDGRLEPLPIGTAAWIDDAGLRRSTSPTEAFLADAPSDWIEPPVLDAASARRAAQLDSAELAGLYAVLVDDLGRWDDAIALAGAVADRDDRDRLDELTLLRTGSLLAIASDARCLDVFAHVATHADDPVDRTLGAFRTAVALVKRLHGSAGQVRVALAATLRCAHDVQDRATRATLRALVHNLEALVEIRERNPRGARDLVRLAWSLIAGDETTTDQLGPQFVAEVRTQVRSNLAVVTGMLDGWADAIPLFERGVEIADAGPSDALRMETGCLLGLARFHAGDLVGARESLHRAEAASRTIALTRQRAQVHKLLALVEHDLGEHERSQRWLDQLHAAGGAA
ncbi:MAG: hypothetical protein JWL76_979 [Thermoleophilia bacterium]|nr:hypothetical protein [Thermoleophilia bacterium]